MGAVQILTHSMVAVDRGELGAQGLRPARLRARRRGRRRPALRRADRARGRDAAVLVPPYPGITAAMGLLATDMVYEYVATAYQRLSKLDAPSARSARSRSSRRRPRAQLEAGRHRRPTSVVIQRIADCRYLGQGYELRVDVASGRDRRRLGREGRARDFHDIHEREYSRRFEDSDIEIPNVRVRGIGLMPELADAGGRARRRVAATRRCATRARRGSASTASSSRSPTRFYDRDGAAGRATGSRGRRSSTSTTRRP